MKVALLGFGTVGSGCMEALQQAGIQVSRVLDKRDIPEIAPILTKNIDDILNDPEIGVVAELMGGEHPACDFVKAALLAGKNVVTANKQMLSLHYGELTGLAEEKGLCLEYSATSGGGIPWLYNLKRVCQTDTVTEIGGVMNGTTNYILDAMQTKGESYEEALKKAQALGFAEADPTADVMGYDVRAKLAISCNVAWGGELAPESIPTEGITKITVEDVKNAQAQGKAIRLVARAKKEDGKISAEIKPILVGSEDPLFNLSGPENCFYLIGNRSGRLCFKGAGAGKGPTGRNVAEDIIEIGNKKCLR